MIKRQFLAVALAASALAINPAFAWRGGGFGGFHGGDSFGGGGFHGESFHGAAGGEGAVVHGPDGGAAGVYRGPAGGWHPGGVGGYGGTWHADGYHAGGYWGGGYSYHGPAVVNSYYGGGCYACGAAVIGGVAALAIGASLATLPPACGYRVVGGAGYYVCGGQWMQPQYGYGGVHYVVVPPL
jgi:hypothetical protein